jgi:Transposase/Transposase IS116/IS110/IS902 family
VNGTKFVAMDVHTATISVAVLNFDGKLIMESVIEAKGATIIQFVQGLRGELFLTFEEGTWSAWLYDLLQPHVTKIVVCDPRRNALLKEGSANDRIDARKLAELLRLNSLRSVYHGENGLRTLKELARAYLTISKDIVRVMNRVKAVYRSWGIPCAGQSVYNPGHREEWLRKITQTSVRRRAELFYEQLDALVPLRKQARQELLAESKKHQAWKLLRSIPALGPIRAAVLMAIVQTPHRFRTKRMFWKYSGFGVVTQTSADHQSVNGQLQRSKKPVFVRGLDRAHNHDLKYVFKSAAIQASTTNGPLREFYQALVAKGMRPDMARLTLARKIATISWMVWRKGVAFDAKFLKPQTA